MVADNDFLIPAWPETLQHVDVVKTRFTLDFITSCQVKPADFLEIGRALRLAGRQLFDVGDADASEKCRSLFQPSLSDDPIARRKFQKPSPAFVVTMPIMEKVRLEAGDQLELEVLFIGTGIPLIHEFLRSLVHLGHLGLAAGEGRFEVLKLCSCEPDGSENQVWQQDQSTTSLACSVQPLSWLLSDDQVPDSVSINFLTPTRLMVEGKPLRKPLFKDVFPFILRRVTSMLYAHCGLEVLEAPSSLLVQSRELNVMATRLCWLDWRPLPGRQGLVVGGFTGEMVLQGQSLKDLYWVLSVASLFGVGKGATYGAGRFMVSH